MPTLEERVTRLETDMEEQKRLRASQDRDLSDVSEQLRVQTGLVKALAKTQSGHTAMLNRHTAMHNEHAGAIALVSLNVHGLKNGMQQIIGMLDTLIQRDNSQ